jgi:hypothetical protein
LAPTERNLEGPAPPGPWTTTEVVPPEPLFLSRTQSEQRRRPTLDVLCSIGALLLKVSS